MAKSVETQLAESIGEMSEVQKKAFWERRGSGFMPVEGILHLAKECLSDVRESKITRNNGATRDVSESPRDVMAETDKVLFEGMARARSTAKGLENVVEVNGEYRSKADGTDRLTESEAQDLAFCRLLGMSESDSLKVVKSNFIRGN